MTPFNAQIYGFGRVKPAPEEPETPRWIAHVVYWGPYGRREEVFEFDEFSELGDLIEAGEDWTQIYSFEIVYNL